MNFKYSKNRCAFVASILVGCTITTFAQNIVVGEPVMLESSPPISDSKTVTSTPNSLQETGSEIISTTPKQLSNLSITAGERLKPTLKKWLADQNVDLVWAATSSSAGRVRDVVLEADFESTSFNVSEALTEILSPFDFEAEIAQNNGVIKRVTVRNARNGL